MFNDQPTTALVAASTPVILPEVSKSEQVELIAPPGPGRLLADIGVTLGDRPDEYVFVSKSRKQPVLVQFTLPDGYAGTLLFVREGSEEADKALLHAEIDGMAEGEVSRG